MKQCKLPNDFQAALLKDAAEVLGTGARIGIEKNFRLVCVNTP